MVSADHPDFDARWVARWLCSLIVRWSERLAQGDGSVLLLLRKPADFMGRLYELPSVMVEAGDVLGGRESLLSRPPPVELIECRASWICLDDAEQ